MRSYLRVRKNIFEVEGDLEPDDDEVPETDHEDLGGGGPDRFSGVFDGGDVHEVTRG